MNGFVFVFGSNRAGIHGTGAAAFAYIKHGAKWGQGEGRSGMSYAIPTKAETQRMTRKGYAKGIGRPLSLNEIARHVDKFIDYARNHPELRFQVTAVGCGMAGHQHEDIAPLFADAPDNCWFDILWAPLFRLEAPLSDKKYWGTF